MRSRLSVFVLSIIIILSAQAANAVNIPSTPRDHVIDLAQIVNDSTEAQLNAYLHELEQKTTAQVVVLTIPSLEGNDLNAFSLEVANDMWKLGQKGKDNGLLLLVALQERKYRFEVGYGLEGILPDSLVGSIGRQQMLPRFKQGDYSGGIESAVIAIANIIAKDNGVQISGMPAVTYQYQSDRNGNGETPGPLGLIIAGLFFVFFIYMFIKHPRLMILFLLTSGSGRGGSWGGGGGFGGGSFGGGGGGGFGGGGASGGW